MRNRYLLSPAAAEKLEAAQITSRIRTAIRDDSFPHPPSFGFITDSDIPSFGREMQDRKIFSHATAAQRTAYVTATRQGLQDFDHRTWLSGGKQHRAEYEDFITLMGYLACHVLKPDELWLPEKFGFTSHWDLLGCVSAATCNETYARMDRRKAPTSYKTNYPDERTLETTVGATVHGDLCLEQTDLTWRPTTDPLGNEVVLQTCF